MKSIQLSGPTKSTSKGYGAAPLKRNAPEGGILSGGLKTANTSKYTLAQNLNTNTPFKTKLTIGASALNLRGTP